MEIDEAIEYVRRNHHAVLATLKQDGSPQLSPVTAGVDGDGHVIISTRQTAYKVRHIRRDPREKERKKAGLKKARKAPQYSKR